MNWVGYFRLNSHYLHRRKADRFPCSEGCNELFYLSVEQLERIKLFSCLHAAFRV